MLQYEVSPKDRALSCSNFFLPESVWEGVKWKSFGYRYVRWWSFCCISGDIDGGKGGMADKEAMQLEAGYTGKYRAAWEQDTDRKFL